MTARRALLLAAALPLAVCGAPGVTADPAAHTVRIAAKACGMTAADTVEFVAVAAGSDHAYESIFETLAGAAEIAAALEAAGIPRGLPPDSRKARFWPCGESVEVSFRIAGGPELPLSSVLKDTSPSAGDSPAAGPAVATLGERRSDGSPEAAANSPFAVFALYNCPQSLLAVPGSYMQSAVYGRFKPAMTIAGDTPAEIIVKWSGERRVRRYGAVLSQGADGKILARTFPADGGKTRPGDGAPAAEFQAFLAEMRNEKDKGRDVYLTPGFSRETTLAQAAAIAAVFPVIDGKGVKVNGALPGQPFYQSYLPDESWRERKNRPFQPFEIHIAPDGSKKFVFVREDWSGEGLDPVLLPRETPLAEWSDIPKAVASTGEVAEKMDVAAFFMPGTMQLGAVFDAMAHLPSGITTVYVFQE